MSEALTAASYHLTDDGGTVSIVPSGDWTVLALGDAPLRLKADLEDKGARRRFDAHQLGRVDTAGVFALMRVLGDPSENGLELDLAGRDELERLADLVKDSLDPKPAPRHAPRSLHALFERIGRATVALWQEAYAAEVFIGRLVVALARTIVSPRRLRLIPLVATMEQAGLDALPIVVTMTFFIGAVLALVGSTLLTTLGVKVYAVELVGIGVLREFGAVVAAILLAGRSASAFAAQLGSMRMTQEIDAMQVMGVDRFDALVVPRVLAALIMLPIMTLCADVGGLIGGLLVSAVTMDISPAFFVQRLVAMVGLTQFWIGMSKAPFFAIVIAATGCRQGLATGGDVESLGARVTAAVVQSIFLIIMFDAIFALVYRNVGQ
ncbi:ABC transporter permease [Sphingomonas bacterium]|uniref:ABC transporter permease n=1 Tax=Sphingomonas bacterium TaxID=1895847 RepID=UPI001576E5E2|nr:ABC transporter permease [Sphingomonas bacterium]